MGGDVDVGLQVVEEQIDQVLLAVLLLGVLIVTQGLVVVISQTHRGLVVTPEEVVSESILVLPRCDERLSDVQLAVVMGPEIHLVGVLLGHDCSCFFGNPDLRSIL